jgi:hypothetical protein
MPEGMFLPLRLLLGGMTLHASPSMPPSLRSALSQLRMCSHVQNYTGGVFGVSAEVELNLRTRVAHVKLEGIPIGGKVEGEGWLASPTAETGPVVLEPGFEAALRRRRIRITTAALDRNANTVLVTASVPVLGEQRILLRAVHGPPARPPPMDAPAPLCAPPSSPAVPAHPLAPGSDLLAIAQLLAGGGPVAA